MHLCITLLSHLTGHQFLQAVPALEPGYFDSSAVKFPGYSFQPASTSGPHAPSPGHPQHVSTPQDPLQFHFPISPGSRPPTSQLTPVDLDAVIIDAKHHGHPLSFRQPKQFSSNLSDINRNCRGYSMLGCVWRIIDNNISNAVEILILNDQAIKAWNMSSWMKSWHRKLLLALFPCTNQLDPVFQESSKLRNPQSNWVSYELLRFKLYIWFCQYLQGVPKK